MPKGALSQVSDGAAFGVYPNAGKRSKNDRTNSADMPLQALRGWAAGTLGLPGDVEALGRRLIGVNTDTTLPTTDQFKQALPFGNDSPAGQLAGNAGSMLGGVGVSGMAEAGAKGLSHMAENAMLPRMLNPQTGAVLWHGSPHSFNAFDASKIGTGEGAQAYGHGLYLAENPEVATKYVPRDPASEARLYKAYHQAEAKGQHPAMEVHEAYMTRNTPTDVAKTIADMGPMSAADKLAVDKAHAYGTKEYQNQAGQLYKIDLPDEHINKMLDWDKPLHQQPKNVQEALAKHDPDTYHPTGDDYDAMELGQSIYQRIKNPSQAMQQAGIPGIKYFDAGSRDSGGTSNYVVFPGNEHLLNITERNGQAIPQPTAPEGALAKYANGGSIAQQSLAPLSGPGGIQQLGMNFGGADYGAVAQPKPVAAVTPTATAQNQVQSTSPDTLDQIGTNLGKSALSSDINNLTGTDFGGPLTSLAMGADPTKVATNYGEQQAISAGLGAAGADAAVPYAGAITSALNGNFGSAAGSVAGEVLGDMVLPGVGGYIGSAIGGSIGGGCYITTASTVANGKTDDDAYELKTLRHFRDTFMREDPFLSKLADDYEELSPAIVAGINARKDSAVIYKHIHTKYLVPATRAVTRGQNKEALHIYADMVDYVAPMAIHTSPDPQAVATLGHEAKMVVKATA